MQTIGAPGFTVWGGKLQSNERNSALTGTTRYKTFSDNLVNVAIIGAGVRFFLNMCAKASWKLEAPEDSGTRGEELAELTEEILHDMDSPWNRVVRRAAMYRFYGFATLEWTAKRRDDGAIGFLDVEARPQITIEDWDTEDSGKVLGIVQRSPQTGGLLPIPREKLLYLVDDSLSDSPEGLGLFRHLVEPATKLTRLEQLEGYGYEGDLRGIPIVRAPLTELAKMVTATQLTQAQSDALVAPLQEFVQNHVKNPNLGMLLDSQTWQSSDERQSPSNVPQFNAELLDGGSYSLSEVHAAIQRKTMDCARILGVEHLLLGEGSAGSFALSKDKSHNFGLIIDSTLNELRQAFESDLIDPLWLLNGWPEELKPKLIFDTNASRDIGTISQVLSDLASSGIVLDREDDVVQEVLRLLGLPRLLAMEEMDPEMALQPEQPEPKGEPSSAEPEELPEDPEDEL
tara:strand:- start:446 stop:1816 length:1371 start_codon:yes stop_codon:yes gene_type:complete